MSEIKKNTAKVELKLTPEQIEEIKKAFGEEFAKRLKNIEVDQIAGFLRTNLKVN